MAGGRKLKDDHIDDGPRAELGEEIIWAIVGFLLLEDEISYRRYRKRLKLILKAFGKRKDMLPSLHDRLMEMGYVVRVPCGGKEIIRLGHAAVRGMGAAERKAPSNGEADMEAISKKLLALIAEVPEYLVGNGFSSAELLSSKQFEEVKRYADGHGISVEKLENLLYRASDLKREDFTVICRGYLPEFPRYFPRGFRDRILRISRGSSDIKRQIFSIVSINGKLDRSSPITRDEIARIFGVADGRYYIRRESAVKKAYPRKYLDSRLKTLEKKGVISRREDSTNGVLFETGPKGMYVPKRILDEVEAVMYRRAQSEN